MGYTLKLNGSVAKNVRIVSGGQTSEVNTILNDDGVVWDKPVLIDSPMRVTNSNDASRTVTLTKIGTPHDLYMEYSTDNTNWHVWSPDSNGNRTASVANNVNFYIRGENPLGFYVDENNRYSFNVSGKYALAGNLNAWYSKYESDSLPANCFRKLFYQSTNLDNISYVKFLATRLGDYAYESMFYGCTGLRFAPHWLPATQLGVHAYDSMFYGCTSLTTMPMIYARDFTASSCQYMFYNCTSLTKQWAAESATSSATRNVTLNVDSISGVSCFHSMFRKTPITTAADIHLDAVSLYKNTYKCMFRECTSLVTGPEIKATSLYAESSEPGNGSLGEMFYGCTSLNYIKVYFTDWYSGNGTRHWTYGTKSSGTFVKPDSLPATKNASGNTSNPHYIPYNWTVQSVTPPSTKSYNVVTSSPLVEGNYYIIVAVYDGNYYMMHNDNWNLYNPGTGGNGAYYDSGTQVTVTNNSVLTVPYSTDMSYYTFEARRNPTSLGSMCHIGLLAFWDPGLGYREGAPFLSVDSGGDGAYSYWVKSFSINQQDNTVLLNYNKGDGYYLTYGPAFYGSSHPLGNSFKLTPLQPATWNIMLFSYT